MKVCLSIAGSDSGCGAGIGADLKTFAAHGVYGTCAITLVTAQNSRGISALQVLEPSLVRAQIRAVFEAFPVAAVKTGALGNAAIIEVVAQELAGRNVPIVVDPVLLSTSGHPLLQDDAIEALRNLLFPLAALVTPNIPEAELLLGFGAEREVAVAFPVLLKGGHGEGATLQDHLLLPDNSVQTWSSPRLDSRGTRGTGCTLAAAIAAQLALGAPLSIAIEYARDYVRAAIAAAPKLEAGNGPLEHFPPVMPFIFPCRELS